MRKELELSYDGGVSGSNKQELMVAPMVWSGEACVWRESGVRRSVLCWGVCHESGLSRCEDVFTFDLVHDEIL
jgi:hypothetical protein